MRETTKWKAKGREGTRERGWGDNKEKARLKGRKMRVRGANWSVASGKEC